MSRQRKMVKRSGVVITLATREASLKRRLRYHLKTLGFTKNEEGLLAPPGETKAVIRAIHGAQRSDRLAQSQRFITERFPSLVKHFASGSDIDPARISPVLERVYSDTDEGDLFRLASLTWSVPVSQGFGRRLRYLVWDEHNEKLIGIIAIGDPVFNLSARDNLIGWNVADRGERLVNVMDAYVLGAVPPYNALLGGKLVASLVRTRDMYDDFSKAYGGTTGIISEKEKRARLLAVTTSSSMGRSSVYNRLKLGGVEYFEPIGYTGGWGHFHIPDSLFFDLRSYLRSKGHTYADTHKFGEGPNWKLRTTRAALVALGFKDDLLRHGIKREVFLSTLASNATRILKTGKGRPNLKSLLSAKEVSQLAVDRWMTPRAERMPDFKLWRARNIADLFGDQGKKLLALLARTG
ncbi:MAG: DUF4338 domain-containing protein [Rhodospirillaceae bacterium]|nr:DUF4338 domain-containing protein [Rhodospirillaceae bacterium]